MREQEWFADPPHSQCPGILDAWPALPSAAHSTAPRRTMQPCVPAGRLEVGAMLCSHSRDMSHGWDACCGRETSATSRNECPYFLAAPTVAGVPAPGHVGAAWARGNHLQSSNHMKLWKPFHWMPTSLACVVSTLTDPAHLSLLLSVVVIVTRFRCP